MRASVPAPSFATQTALAVATDSQGFAPVLTRAVTCGCTAIPSVARKATSAGPRERLIETWYVGSRWGVPSPRLRAPDDVDRSVDARKRQGAGLGLDRVAGATREACPGFDSHGVLRSPPGSADLAVDEERARPDAGRPELLSQILARDQQ